MGPCTLNVVGVGSSLQVIFLKQLSIQSAVDSVREIGSLMGNLSGTDNMQLTDKGLAVKTIIHVNQHVIKANRKVGSVNPPLTVKDYKRTRYCQEVALTGPSKVVYRPDKPLACGAHVWIETQHGVVCIGEKE